MADVEGKEKSQPHPHAASAQSATGAQGSGAGGGPEAAAEGEGGLVATKKEFIQTFFKRAEEFTETLLRENERLRFQILELEDKVRFVHVDTSLDAGVPSPTTLRELATRIEALEQEREQMLGRVRAVQGENLHFEERYREIERENNNLANLYVASFQLHSTLDLREVTQIILEILLNFVGAKTFAVLLLDEQRNTLRPLASEGIPRERVPSVKAADGVIGRVVATGQPLIHTGPVQTGSAAPTAAGARGSTLDLEHPLIVTPLRIKDRVVGAIVIWEFLQQKTELADVDHELFNLLAAHAASALQSAKLALELGGSSAALWGAVDLV